MLAKPRTLAGALKSRAHDWLGRSRSPRGKLPPLAHTPEIDSNRFLFIGGLHRSGTSVVHRILCAHPRASGFHDTGVPEDEGQFLQSVIPPASAFGGPGRFAFDPASSLDQLIEEWTQSQTNMLLRQWGAYYDLGKAVLLEKSPPNVVRHRLLRHVFPGARFLFILRHPVCVALATRKWTKSSLVEILLHWRAAHHLLVRSRPRSNVLVLRYEDMVKDEGTTLARAAAFAGLEQYSPTVPMIDHNAKYFTQWERDFGDESAFMAGAFPDFERFIARAGYSLQAPYIDPTFDPDRFFDSTR